MRGETERDNVSPGGAGGSPALVDTHAGAHEDDRTRRSLVLLIQETKGPNRDDIAGLLHSDSEFQVQRASWDTVAVETLNRCKVDLIVAVADRGHCRVVEFFQRLLAHSLGVPTFAVLPDLADDALTRAAIEAADDFAVSPVERSELRHRVARLLPRGRSTMDVVRRLTHELGLSELVGSHPAFARVVELLPAIGRSDSPVLITGETGTGKELCARAIHHFSHRRNMPFVAVDCAAIPDHIFENELFGHARGAYTDAHRDQRGLIAIADGGTLFLDEVDSLSVPVQAKLLRFLEDRTYRPLGSDRFTRADVNVIAATNGDLESRVRDKVFRADLHFRLNVIRVRLPPLRERHGDVPLLATHFLGALNARNGPRKSFSSSALRRLAAHEWPGNVRELRNVVQRAFLLCEGPRILPGDLGIAAPAPAADEAAEAAATFRQGRARAVATFERAYVEELLHKHHGNVTRAATEARKDRRAFGRLVKKYSIDRRSV